MTSRPPFFAAKDFDQISRHVTEAESLPPWSYSSPEFFRLEVEQIFRKVWNCVGHVTRIPQPGDYFSFEIARIPIIVARGLDNEVRAFANTCRHRGTLLVDGHGNCRRISCPYHNWTYELDGRLIAAPTNMEKTARFDMTDYGLLPVRLAQWNGFLFVNFDQTAPGIKEYFGDLTAFLEPYRLDELVQTWSHTYIVKCNWKNYFENLRDQLHVGTVHKKTFQKTVPIGQINRELLPSNGAYSVAFIRTPKTTALLDGVEGFPQRPHLSGRYAEGSHTPLLYPGMSLGCAIDCCYYFMVTPIDVETTRVEVGVNFPPDVVKRSDFNTVAQRYYDTFLAIMDEDNPVLERQFRGLNSPLARAGRYSWREEGVHRAGRWVAEQVLHGQSAQPGSAKKHPNKKS